MSLHTPGPWRLERTFNGWAGFAPSLGYIPERTIFQCGMGRAADAELDANARLIAAAPDLLSAAKAILYADERGQGVGYAEAMEALVAAIAKAEGQS